MAAGFRNTRTRSILGGNLVSPEVNRRILARKLETAIFLTVQPGVKTGRVTLTYLSTVNAALGNPLKAHRTDTMTNATRYVILIILSNKFGIQHTDRS